MPLRISDNRLNNLIIFVISDEVFRLLELGEDNESAVSLARAYGAMRQTQHILQIKEWVRKHTYYVSDKNNPADPHYRELITDAMYIIWLDYYNDGSTKILAPYSGEEYAKIKEHSYQTAMFGNK